MFNSIDDHKKTVKIVQGTQRVTICDKSKFQEICQNNFKNYDETINLEPMKLLEKSSI